jgi:hypothetical protein
MFLNIFVNFIIVQKMTDVLYPHLMTVSEYAGKMGVTVPAVWKKVKSGIITPTYVGFGRHLFINWEEYATVIFEQNRKNRSMGHHIEAFIGTEITDPESIKKEGFSVAMLRLNAKDGRTTSFYKALDVSNLNRMDSGLGVVVVFPREKIDKALKEPSLTQSERQFLEKCKKQPQVSVLFE